MQLSGLMLDKALEEAFDAELIQDGSPDNRAKVASVVTAALGNAGFVDLVEIARELLEAHYPAEIFDGSSGDPGPVFVTRLRGAMEALQEADLRNLAPRPTRVQLESELHALRVERANRLADAERICAWLDDPDRKSAVTAFTEGPERQIAYRFEDLLRGEFVCKRCGLRKDGETTPPSF